MSKITETETDKYERACQIPGYHILANGKIYEGFILKVRKSLLRMEVLTI